MMLQEDEINDTTQNEKIYLAAYVVIKRMQNDGIISKEAYERLNARIASKQHIKPITV